MCEAGGMSDVERCRSCKRGRPVDENRPCACGARTWEQVSDYRDEFESLLGDDAWDNTD